MKIYVIALLIWLAWAFGLPAQVPYGVPQAPPCWQAASSVRINVPTGRSGEFIGGSGTVIATGTGWSLILTCRHLFEFDAGGMDQRLLRARMSFDIPSNPKCRGGGPVGSQVIGYSRGEVDAALIRLNAGPLPYVSPVAPDGFAQGGLCLSAGYDHGQFPPRCLEAHIVASERDWTYTREKPDHGRSGGPLIDKATGYVVGVCHGYEALPRGRGIYASHRALKEFIDNCPGVTSRGPQQIYTPLVDGAQLTPRLPTQPPQAVPQRPQAMPAVPRPQFQSRPAPQPFYAQPCPT